MTLTLPPQKERLPFAEYVAAAIVEVARQLGVGVTCRLEELPGTLKSHFSVEIDPQEIADAIEILRDCDIAYVAQDPLAGTFVRVTQDKFSAFLSAAAKDSDRYHRAIEDAAGDSMEFLRIEDTIETPIWDLLRKYKVIQKYSEFGSPFVEAAMSRVGQADLAERLAFGSDRIVNFADNLPVVEEIRLGLDKLREEIKTNNEVGDALGDGREEALAEVGALQTALAGNQTRAAYLLALSKRVLGWIGRLTAKTSLEELVKHLSKLFIGWLS